MAFTVDRCALAHGDTALASYVEQRFYRSLPGAYGAWIAENEPTTGPFEMKEYIPPATTEAAAADRSADSRFADALVFSQRVDNYTILTVIFALVLFFATASSRLGCPHAQSILLGVAITFLITPQRSSPPFPSISEVPPPTRWVSYLGYLIALVL